MLDGEGHVRNALELHLVNKQSQAQRFVIRPETSSGLHYAISAPSIELGPMAERRVPMLVIGAADGKPRKVALVIEAGAEERRVEASFAAPR